MAARSARSRFWLRSAICVVLASLAVHPVHADTPLVVATITAEATETLRRRALTGEIVAPDTLQAAFRSGGRIAQIMVDDGDAVSEGDVLARIEQIQQEQSVRAAEASLSAAEAEFAAASEDNERQTALLDRGATTRATQTAAADRLAAATARRAQAEAELTQARDALADTVLRAPADAVVIERLAEPGMVVGAAQPVLRLALGDGYEALFDVPESLLTQTPANGIPAITLSPVNRPRTTVTGHVREISPLVDPATGTVEVRVALDAPLPGLSYGDAVRGAAEEVEDARISLPWTALMSIDAGPAVWVVDPASSRVSLRPIVIHRYGTDTIFVQSGLEDGETVVSLGHQLLYPDREVTAMEAGQ